MIKVEIVYSNKNLTSLKVKGHANSNEYGKDLVCAAVSAVTIGALNALEDDSKFEIEVEPGDISLIVKEKPSEHDLTVLEIMILQLKTIEVSYSSYISIKERK